MQLQAGQQNNKLRLQLIALEKTHNIHKYTKLCAPIGLVPFNLASAWLWLSKLVFRFHTVWTQA